MDKNEKSDGTLLSKTFKFEVNKVLSLPFLTILTEIWSLYKKNCIF